MNPQTNCSQCGGLIRLNQDKRRHPVLGVLQCLACYLAYKKVGDLSQYRGGVDLVGNDNFCKWCLDGGDLILCADENCRNGFCRNCLERNFSPEHCQKIEESETWYCFVCNYTQLDSLRVPKVYKKHTDNENSNSDKEVIEIEPDISTINQEENCHDIQETEEVDGFDPDISIINQRETTPDIQEAENVTSIEPQDSTISPGEVDQDIQDIEEITRIDPQISTVNQKEATHDIQGSEKISVPEPDVPQINQKEPGQDIPDPEEITSIEPDVSTTNQGETAQDIMESEEVIEIEPDMPTIDDDDDSDNEIRETPEVGECEPETVTDKHDLVDQEPQKSQMVMEVESDMPPDEEMQDVQETQAVQEPGLDKPKRVPIRSFGIFSTSSLCSKPKPREPSPEIEDIDYTSLANELSMSDNESEYSEAQSTLPTMTNVPQDTHVDHSEILQSLEAHKSRIVVDGPPTGETAQPQVLQSTETADVTPLRAEGQLEKVLEPEKAVPEKHPRVNGDTQSVETIQSEKMTKPQEVSLTTDNVESENQRIVKWMMTDAGILFERLKIHVRALESSLETFDESQFKKDPMRLFSWTSNVESFLNASPQIQERCKHLHNFIPYLKK